LAIIIPLVFLDCIKRRTVKINEVSKLVDIIFYRGHYLRFIKILMSFFVHELYFSQDITCFRIQYPPKETVQFATLLGQHSGRWQLRYMIRTSEGNSEGTRTYGSSPVWVNLLTPDDRQNDRVVQIPANESLDLVSVYLEPSWARANVFDNPSCTEKVCFSSDRLASPSERTQICNLLKEANAFNEDKYEDCFWQLMRVFKKYCIESVL
jgi:hypothetical protein